ncbi:MAG TPA: LptF/LptG family permease, partial [Nitrospirae bacterium]|nr:LptF/LptG family permease [Nitrospirota bacterium]
VYLVVQYLLLQVPRSILIASPIASLLSILFTIGMAAKWKETLAIRASGGSLKRFFSYFLTLGIIISLCALVFGETLAPIATSRASWVRNTQILKNESRITFREGMLWLKGLDGSLIRIRDFVEDKNRILKVSIFEFSPSFELTRRIEAAEAEWIDGKWELKNAIVFDFENDTVTAHDSFTFFGLEEPNIFREEMKKTGEMNFKELYHYYKRLERAGFKNNRYVVELYGKLAQPLVNFVMIMFGIALALNSRWGGGIRAAGLGLVVIIVYLMVFAVSISLGNTGTLPPALAPWISPAIFCITGSYMFLKIRE